MSVAVDISNMNRSGFAIKGNLNIYTNFTVTELLFESQLAPPQLRLLAIAQRAASLADLRAQVTAVGHARRAVSLWDESRVWDPGD